MLGNNRIVLDVDGVILNFNDHFRKHVSEVLHRDIKEYCKSYELHERLNISKAEHDLAWSTFGDMGKWKDIEPLPGSREAVLGLINMGYEIYLVTGIDEEYKEHRLKNLIDKIDFLPKEIHCVGSGRTLKDHKIREINPVMFVDDRLEQLHTNQEVPLLVWVDHGDEQHPIDGKRIDHTTTSLSSFYTEFLKNAKYFEEKVNKNVTTLVGGSKKNARKP